jgi:hypothetical protein
MALALGSREAPFGLNRFTGGLEGKTFAFRLHDDKLVLKVHDGVRQSGRRVSRQGADTSTSATGQ